MSHLQTPLSLARCSIMAHVQPFDWMVHSVIPSSAVERALPLPSATLQVLLEDLVDYKFFSFFDWLQCYILQQIQLFDRSPDLFLPNSKVQFSGHLMWPYMV